jgi:hypothetical protein
MDLLGGAVAKLGAGTDPRSGTRCLQSRSGRVRFLEGSHARDPSRKESRFEYQVPMFCGIEFVDAIALLIAKEFCPTFRHMYASA